MADFKAFVSGESEQAFRKFWARLFKQSGTAGIAQAGVLGSGADLLVSQTSTASASVQVASGLALAQDTVGNGVSPLLRDATGNLDVLTANPMGATPRNDIVVFDSATSTVRVIVGTPNAVPTDPTVPSTAVALARLRHAASATTVPSSKIDDLRTFTAMAGPAQAAGRFTTAFLAANNRTGNVSFPVGRFSAPPTVTMQVESSSGASRNYMVQPYSVTATGFVYFLRTIDSSVSSDADVPLVWQAIEVG